MVSRELKSQLGVSCAQGEDAGGSEVPHSACHLHLVLLAALGAYVPKGFDVVRTFLRRLGDFPVWWLWRGRDRLWRESCQDISG